MTGEHGILTQTEDSKYMTERAEIIERAKLDVTDIQIGNHGKISEEELVGILTPKYGTLSDNEEESVLDKTLTTTDGKFTILVSEIYDGNLSGGSTTKSYYYDPNLVPTDPQIFDYEVIETASTSKLASTTVSDMGLKIAETKPSIRIKGIKDEYKSQYYDNFRVTPTNLLVIPYEIDGKIVTELGEKFLWGNANNVKKIVLPNTITKLGDRTFSMYNNPEECVLEEVVLSNKLTSIDADCFKASTIKRVVLPEGVKELSGSSLSGCPYLTEVVIPESVTSIGYIFFNDGQSSSNTVSIKYRGTEEQWNNINKPSSDWNLLWHDFKVDFQMEYNYTGN